MYQTRSTKQQMQQINTYNESTTRSLWRATRRSLREAIPIHTMEQTTQYNTT